MDPNKGGIGQKVITFLLKIILNIVLLVIRNVLKKEDQEIVEPDHLIQPPAKPIPSLKLAIALNPNTPLNKLKVLVKEPDHFVRRALCRNPSIEKEQLKMLCQDSDLDVRAEAENALNERNKFDLRKH